ncbi:MAG: helix-turn-helix domain-containing protein [Ardenticatenaceae bacterium]|nr:helix-turn-helix domain-containing protein [Ardenticatenaceae bacterium]
MSDSLQDRNLYAWLNGIARDGGSMGSLAEALATIVQRSVVIEDSSLRNLAYVLVEPLDALRKSTVVNSRAAPFVSKRLLNTGIYERMKQELRPVIVEPIPNLGMTLERLVAPIVVSREIFGYIWVITGGLEPELLTPAVEQAALVAAVILFKERIDQEQAMAQRQIFLQQLLKEKEISPDLTEQARRIGIWPNQPYQVLIIHGPPESGGNPRPLLREVQEWLHHQRRRPFVVWHEERVVILHDGDEGDALAQDMAEQLAHPARNILIGVSQESTDLGQLVSAYKQASEAILIAKQMGQINGVALFSKLGLLYWLYQVPSDALTGNPYLAQVKQLSQHDERRRTELVKTLEIFLDHGNNLVETAQVLHIHRNTLVHRLRRIEALCGMDLRNPLERLNLHAAVKQFRLRS